MQLDAAGHPLIVVVGSGGVGKTTLAAALGLVSARSSRNTLVMTFDPSLRLKDTLGIDASAGDREIEVRTDTPGRLDAGLLDARKTFDRLIDRYAPDEAARRRILDNRFYHHLAGHLAGILEYMAVERLFEAAGRGRYDRIVLDTPPTRQALDFLEAPDRIVSFLDSGALRLALMPWFDDRGHLRATSRLWGLGRGIEALLDRVVGLSLLREMAEFFQAFAPLYEGFRERAVDVKALLRSPRTLFVVVSGPGEDAIPDTMFFARRLRQAGHTVGPIVVNRLHPCSPEAVAAEPAGPPRRLAQWLAERDRRGLEAIRALAGADRVIGLPLLAQAPTDPASLEALGTRLLREAAAVQPG